MQFIKDHPEYSLRLMHQNDFDAIEELCQKVYPDERPYTNEELFEHQALYPQGQLVIEYRETKRPVGVHFGLRLNIMHYHLDDDWETLTSSGSFLNHDPEGHSLYGADLFIHPEHQHHGLAKELTSAMRDLVKQESLWRMIGGSRMPGYGLKKNECDPNQYIEKVKAAEWVDPVLTAHLHDGWQAMGAIRGYLPHDEESAGYAAVIQWINPDCPPPAKFDLSRLSKKS